MSTLKRSIRNYMQVAMVLAFFCLVFLNIAIPIYGDAKSEGYELLEYNQETQILKYHEYEGAELRKGKSSDGKVFPDGCKDRRLCRTGDERC